MANKNYDKIIKEFEIFSGGSSGIDNWINSKTHSKILERLNNLDKTTLTFNQFNELLVLSGEKDISVGFFDYYWQKAPDHPYDVRKIPKFKEDFLNKNLIVSLNHLWWGFYRLFTDALLFFGNIAKCYNELCDKSFEYLKSFFTDKSFNTKQIKNRGPALSLVNIKKDNRYLISEMACKTYDAPPDSQSEFKEYLLDAWDNYKRENPGKRATFNELLTGEYSERKSVDLQQYVFSANELLEESISKIEDIEEHYGQISNRFFQSRKSALENTTLYLSRVKDLDVYVATSMRSRQDFREMADFCDKIFSHTILKDLNLRYFDPTISAAKGHEDKGLIECLMVKCAKLLIYHAGEKESWGKIAEASIALCLGKPVIIYCKKTDRDGKRIFKDKFYREVHPLTRLIEFKTGVAVGAIVTDDENTVIELLRGIFENNLEYILERKEPGYFRLKEKLTDSVVRLQTNDTLLSETFWNSYHDE